MRIATAVVLAGALVTIGSKAHADTLVGSVPLPVSYSGSVHSSTEIDKGKIYIDWTDYVSSAAGTSIRVCASFTDWGTNNDSLTMGLGWFKWNGQADGIAEVVLGNTWSGGGLYHQKCGQKVPLADMNACGAAWGNTCGLFAQTNGGTYGVTFNTAWVEIFKN
jgi:hypothetical protein